MHATFPANLRPLNEIKYSPILFVPVFTSILEQNSPRNVSTHMKTAGLAVVPFLLFYFAVTCNAG
jgi:hypothetical protein